MDTKEIMKALQAPFPEEDIEWRVQRAVKVGDKGKAIVLAYVTNRAIQNRLDSLFGIDGWKNEYKEMHDGILCGISIKINDEWITKWDGADITNIEPTKGGLSGSMKRAAVQWGIGRYLYDLEEEWVEIKDQGRYYINDKKTGVKGKWDPPKLPAWALPEVDNILSTIKAKYKQGKGSMEGFEAWYGQQMLKGRTHNEMNEILTHGLKKGA